MLSSIAFVKMQIIFLLTNITTEDSFFLARIEKYTSVLVLYLYRIHMYIVLAPQNECLDYIHPGVHHRSSRPRDGP